jgi:hypothetical protein
VIQPDKLVVAEHSTEAGHCITFKDTMVLAKIANYMDGLVKEVIKICLHPDNFNRDMGLTLN